MRRRQVRSRQTVLNGTRTVRIPECSQNGEIIRRSRDFLLHKNSGYGKKPLFTSAKGKCRNTAVKNGTGYCSEVRGFAVIDGQLHWLRTEGRQNSFIKAVSEREGFLTLFVQYFLMEEGQYCDRR